MNRKWIVGWITGLALAALLGGTRTGNGAVVTVMLTDNDATSANAKYQVTFDNSKLSLNYSSTDVGNQQGTITINAIWGAGQLDTRSVTFAQTQNPGGGFDSTEGLRLQLELGIGNESGKAWSSFAITTDDNSVPAGGVGQNIDPEGGHRYKAHFHPNSGGPIISGTGFNTTNAFNNTQMIKVSGGQLSSGVGQGFLMAGFFVHERNLQDNLNADVKRTFTLNLKPTAVPEPSTLIAGLTGALALAATASLRRRGVKGVGEAL